MLSSIKSSVHRSVIAVVWITELWVTGEITGFLGRDWI